MTGRSRWAAIAASAACALFVTTGPSAARTGNVTGLYNRRYCEIFVATRHLARVDARVYNTLGLNDCPAVLWSRIDAGALKAQLKAVYVYKNGPRYFLMDSSAYSVPGEPATFDGLAMRQVASIAVSPFALLGTPKRRPYSETTIKRTTRWIFNSGRRIYELVAPDGRRYVMQSYSQIVDPNLNLQKLAALAPRMRLPAGWTYRSSILAKRLELATVNGEAHVIQDDFEDTYQRR